MSLTIPQANTLQALHQEQLARSAAATLPNLAAMHSRHFLTMAHTQRHSGDAMWATQKVSSVQYRRSLWAEDIEPDIAPSNADASSRIVPDFYHKHNSRCPRCALPLIPGLNQLSLPPNTKKSTSKSTKQRTRSKARKRTSHCTLCLHKTRS